MSIEISSGKCSWNVSKLEAPKMERRIPYTQAAERVALVTRLRDWNWAIVGTPPLGLDGPDSDIDVVCEVDDFETFSAAMWRSFSHFDNFAVWQWISDTRSVVTRFDAEDWTFEVFASQGPIQDQKAWRHFAVEKRLLAIGGNDFLKAVRMARSRGLKTEPAFAAVLHLPGNPYEALLRLYGFDDRELVKAIAAAGFPATHMT